MVVWVQNGHKCIVIDPHDDVAVWKLQLAAPAQHQERVYYITYCSLGKRSKFKICSSVSTEHI